MQPQSPQNEWNDKDFQDAGLAIEEMVRHFIMSYRLYTLRENHSETKIIDIAIFDGRILKGHQKFIILIIQKINLSIKFLKKF